MDFELFIEAAEEWDSLGWAVQAQVRDLIDQDFDYGSLNENAVSMISRFADILYSNYGIDTNGLHTAIDIYESLEPEED